MRCPIHIKAMPVQASRLVAQMVAHSDSKMLASRDLQGGYRPLPVYADNRPVVPSIGVAVDPRDVVLEFGNLCAGDRVNEK